MNWYRSDGLQGFCSWVLGEEDPAIWTLPAAAQIGGGSQRARPVNREPHLERKK